MKKYGLVVLSFVLVMTLAACQSKQEKKGSEAEIISPSSQTETEDASEAERFLKEAMEQMEAQEKQAREAKQERIESGETLVQLTGELTDVFTKPESGLDIYQLTVKLETVANDKNKLYQEGIGEEYVFFISPGEHKNLDFSQLKAGDTIQIGTFQDAYLTENTPHQTSEEDVTSIELSK